jgi:hypothetical protein
MLAVVIPAIVIRQQERTLLRSIGSVQRGQRREQQGGDEKAGTIHFATFPFPVE